ncbi:MAG: hypothetical protein Kow0069_38890 [Promethearchaeota archaeon]
MKDKPDSPLLKLLLKVRSVIQETYDFERQLVATLQEHLESTRQVLNELAGVISAKSFTSAMDLYREGGVATKGLESGSQDVDTQTRNELDSPPSPVSPTSVLRQNVCTRDGEVVAIMLFDQKHLTVHVPRPFFSEDEEDFREIFREEVFSPLATRHHEMSLDFFTQDGLVRKIIVKNVPDLEALRMVEEAVLKLYERRRGGSIAVG